MKKILFLLTLFSVVSLASRAAVPLRLSNNSTFADGDIYVAIIGQYYYGDGPHGIYYDLAANTAGNTQVKRLTTGCNTLSKPGVNDRKFANVFTKLSDIKDKTVYLDHTFACRMFFAFKSPMYLHVNDDNGGYAGADFGNPSDPNQGIRWELIEFTYREDGAIWVNTTRVDAFQYPMGLELFGAAGATESYVKTGELLDYNGVINRWRQQHGNDAYAPCLRTNITTDNLGGIILQPSKVTEVKNAGVFDGYINRIWDYYKSHTMRVRMGVLGYWEGSVDNNNVFTLTCKEGNYWFPGSVATVRKPTTVDAIEGAGAFASGDNVSLTVQAMFCGAFNRGVVTTYGTSTQDWSPTGTVNYFSSTEFPCNEYVKFFHQKDLSYDGRTYAFAYDDTFDQSSTCTTSKVDHVVVTIGGFANNGGEGNNGAPSGNNNNDTGNVTSGNGNYKLVWSDEFDSNTLGKNWNVEVTNAPNNNELQAYTNREKNVKIENGNLVITASRENYDGRNFTSARVNSENKVYFTHGKIEASIKMPNLANGLWPAFWMLGNDISSRGWPYCGEIDIMEAGERGGINAGKQNSWAGATIHWGEDWTQHQMWSTNWQHDMGKTIAGDGQYHKWTCEWDDTWIRMYLDDAAEPFETFAINKSIDANITSDAYMHKPYFILFNLAVGGDFPQIYDANGISALGPDASMYIDYVRVYQKEDAVNIVYAENDGNAQVNVPVITPYMQDDSGWHQQTNITINEGSTFALGPQANGNPNTAGTWYWTGPNGFTSNNREITINNASAAQGGNYTVTFTDNNGAKASSTMTVNVHKAPVITPYMMDDSGWHQQTNLTINAGTTFALGPQANGNVGTAGTWYWTGPNGFTSNNREITIVNAGAAQAGNYTVTFTDEVGAKASSTMTVNINNVIAPVITPYVRDNYGWRSLTELSITAGENFSLGPQADQDGSWFWAGPNGYTSNNREITINNASAAQDGAYIVTFTANSGAQTSEIIYVHVWSLSQINIVPYVHNGAGWSQATEVTVNIGGKFAMGPQEWNGYDNGNASWRWTGPNGFTANSREFTIDNVTAAQAGTYTLTFTDQYGRRAVRDFKANVNGVQAREDMFLAGIDEVKATEEKTEIFDLQGRKVSKPTKRGIYVVGGRKVILGK